MEWQSVDVSFSHQGYQVFLEDMGTDDSIWFWEITDG
jgi:hypothetical protein